MHNVQDIQILVAILIFTVENIYRQSLIRIN